MIKEVEEMPTPELKSEEDQVEPLVAKESSDEALKLPVK